MPKANWTPLTTSLLNLEQVTNEALYAVDALASPIINSRTVTTPPSSPVEGDVYIVPPGSSVAWGNPVNVVVGWYGGQWLNFGIPARAVLYVADTSYQRIRYDGGTSAWITF